MIRAFGVSDAGPVRTNNEDRYISDLGLGLFAVADGMGGHKAGEVAAQLAVETITAFVRRSEDDHDVTWPYGIDQSVSYDANRLRTAIFLANRKVFRAAESSDDYGGMGTTVAAVLLRGPNAAIAWVGDTRVYLLSEGKLHQMTADDTWAATILAQDPAMRAEDVARHPMRNVLTNVLGGRATVEVHLTERVLRHGDVLLLTSDGVHGSMAPAVLSETLARAGDPAATAQALVDTALAVGSRDNVTALVVRYEADR